MASSTTGDDGDSVGNDLLPDDVIFNNILPRLPVKPLIRFKSVCKLWHSTISSIEFAKSQLNLSSASSNQVIIMDYDTPSLLLLPYDKLNNINPAEMVAVDISRFKKPYQDFRSCFVCDGLVLLRVRDYKSLPPILDYHLEERIPEGSDTKSYPPFGFFSIYNPATHQFREIADPDSQKFQTHTFWFGYVPSIDDYKILVNFFHKKPHYYYYVYSLRSGTWKMLPHLGEALSETSNVLSHSSTVFNDLLYFSHKHTSPPEKIFAFNFVTEQLKEFPLMDWVNVYCEIQVFVMNGCLSLYCYNEDLFHPISDVWKLRQHDDWSSWEKSLSFDHEGFFSLMKVTLTGKFILVNYTREQLEIIDVCNDGQEQFHGDPCTLKEDTIGVHGGGFYVESLIWPFGTIIESTRQDHED